MNGASQYSMIEERKYIKFCIGHTKCQKKHSYVCFMTSSVYYLFITDVFRYNGSPLVWMQLLENGFEKEKSLHPNRAVFQKLLSFNHVYHSTTTFYQNINGACQYSINEEKEYIRLLHHWCKPKQTKSGSYYSDSQVERQWKRKE
jgi:hypothetical protein